MPVIIGIELNFDLDGWRGGKIMAEIRIKKNESLDKALRRFKNKCQKTGIFREAKKRRYYEKPSDIRKRKESTRKKGR